MAVFGEIVPGSAFDEDADLTDFSWVDGPLSNELGGVGLASTPSSTSPSQSSSFGGGAVWSLSEAKEFYFFFLFRVCPFSSYECRSESVCV